MPEAHARAERQAVSWICMGSNSRLRSRSMEPFSRNRQRRRIHIWRLTMPNISTTVAIAALAVIGSTGCATKGFVRTSVGELDERVNSLSSSVEQTQERVQANEA